MNYLTFGHKNMYILSKTRYEIKQSILVVHIKQVCELVMINS